MIYWFLARVTKCPQGLWQWPSFLELDGKETDVGKQKKDVYPSSELLVNISLSTRDTLRHTLKYSNSFMFEKLKNVNVTVLPWSIENERALQDQRFHCQKKVFVGKICARKVYIVTPPQRLSLCILVRKSTFCQKKVESGTLPNTLTTVHMDGIDNCHQKLIQTFYYSLHLLVLSHTQERRRTHTYGSIHACGRKNLCR